MSATAYPLYWPPGFPRAKFRESGRFKATVSSSLKNVQDSLRLFARDSGKKLERVIISSNCSLADHRPADPGVAVWFVWDGLSLCIAVDRYSSVENNLQAIHHILEARRVELRHGTLALVRATFAGFMALPSSQSREWWDVLQCKADASIDLIHAQYRRLAMDYHPDRGGSQAQMAELNIAYRKAKEARNQ
jgi:hypothetical protein